MRKRNKPLRRYIYRDPDTGQEFMCWRGEALDRVVRRSFGKVLAKAVLEKTHYRALGLTLIQVNWEHAVRLRAPLANP